MPVVLVSYLANTSLRHSLIIAQGGKRWHTELSKPKSFTLLFEGHKFISLLY